MRLLLTSTPRSGNTWLRLMLSDLYQLKQYAVHTPESLDWGQMPDRCIVQLHWDRTPEFARLLAAENFDVLSIARHPLDVLLSILQFASNETKTASWLSGRGGNEELIKGKEIASREFHDYAVSRRAEALLSVTPQWWGIDGGLQVRYEELVKNPADALDSVMRKYGDPLVPFDRVLPNLTMEELRKTSSNNHFWKGSPGHWKSLMPGELVRSIGAAHSNVFEALGYEWNELP